MSSASMNEPSLFNTMLLKTDARHTLNAKFTSRTRTPNNTRTRPLYNDEYTTRVKPSSVRSNRYALAMSAS